MATAAGMKAKLKFIEQESKLQSAMDRLQAMKALRMAEAELEALSEFEGDCLNLNDGNSQSQESHSLLPTVNIHRSQYVQQYVDSMNQAPGDYAVPGDYADEQEDIKPLLLSNDPAPPKQSSIQADAGQYDILKMFTNQLILGRLPTPEPGIFTGNPIDYPAWSTAFKTLIENKGIPHAERLYYLQKYLAGEARETVKGYLLLNTADAYNQAKETLENRYGNPFAIASAYRNTLDGWSKIPSRDGPALRKYGDYLRQCQTAMIDNEGLKILDDINENRKMIAKLPEWLIHRWSRVVSTYKGKYQKFPPFTELVKFVSSEAQIACEPFFRELPPSTCKQKDTKPIRSLATEVAQETCILCKGSHHIGTCGNYMKKTIEERKGFAKDNGLCFSCLRKGHRARTCRHRLTCTVCQRRHPTALHGDTRDEKPEPITTAQSHMNDSTNTSSSTSKASMIVPVWVSHGANPECEVLVYALLDSQSDTSFILDHICEGLGIQGTDIQLSLSTMTAKDYIIHSQRIDGLNVRAYDGNVTLPLPPMYTRDIMPANRSHIPTPDMARKWPHLHPIADKIPPLMDCKVGLLIGYNCSSALAPREVIPPESFSQPYGQRTDLGWGIVGIVDPTELEEDGIGVSHRILTRQAHTPLDARPPNSQMVVSSSSLKESKQVTPQEIVQWMAMDFNDQESGSTLSQDDRRFLKIVGDGITQRPDKHYEMPLPFRSEEPVLPNNRVQAECRLQHLRRRFQKDRKYQQDYTAFMQNIIDSGFAEPVPNDEIQAAEGRVWFIPHHGVYHPKKPDKIRVVFDCSARFKGESINEQLLQGPPLTNALVGVLCRFRQEPIAFMCDVEKMFYQFAVPQHQRNYIRFLWFENGDCKQPIREYRMNVHLFGAVSSPACASFGLRQIADDNEADIGQAAADFIRQDFYVDDGLGSVTTPKEAIRLIKDTKEMCARGGLRLHKFVSNSKEVMAIIPQEDHATGNTNLDLTDGSVERALGVMWNIESDDFHFRITLKDQPLTRRGILSTVSSVYDPLGFVAPVILVGKQILQQMCRESADWDAPVSELLRPRWERWRNDLFHLKDFKLQRCYKPASFGEVTSAELHHFSDASTEGYGQCSYLRLVDNDKRVHCAFVMGKARVTPLKIVTIPRLELTAAVVSVRISNLLKRELTLQQHVSEFFWTDSKVVLGYIANESRRFHVFVANRVQKIRDSTTPEQWLYVKTDDNPADDASRGITAKELTTSARWRTGPDFLWRENHIPDNTDHDIHGNDPEVKKVVVAATTSGQKNHFETERLERFSSWNQARRAVAICLTYKTRLRNQITAKRQHGQGIDSSNTPGPTPSVRPMIQDLQTAEIEILKSIQQECFNGELKILRSLQVKESTPNRDEARKRNQAIKSTSSLYRLDPFLDKDGVMRVGGRIRRANVQFELKHPAILPRKHHMTSLLLRHCHENVKHQGRGMTTNEIRSKGFWIIGCSSAVSDMISKCVTCRRLRSKTQDQKMADLPVDRLEPAPPFTFCAVDYFGPFYIKERRSQLKRYGVLFTCMACRAIHIETADSLSTDSFINSLRRFIAVRGPIRQLRSDRGTNFIGAQAELKKACSELDTTEVRDFLLKECCDYVEFNFNVPSASHMGGVWERQIRTVRSVLDSLMAESGSQLNDESLRTFMSEAMATVNSRPLTVDNLNDPLSLEPLTPNQILTQKTKIILPPPGEFQREDMYLRKWWRRVQYLANQFWSRWKKEYMQLIQSRSKWVKLRRDLQVGDIVIRKEEMLPRNQWPLGRIAEVYPDADGHVRKVKVAVATRSMDAKGNPSHQVSKSFLERPIHKLVLLLENDL